MPGEILSVLQEFYTHNPTKFIIWDLNDASASQVKQEDIDRIADFVLRYSSTRAGGKTAIVALRDLEFGIGRVFDILGDIKEVEFEIKVFRKLSDAADWIGMKELPISD